MTPFLRALKLAFLLIVLPVSAYADTVFNVGVVTDYRYRGISQSRVAPAIQAGVDYTQGGFYAGAWGSSVQWIKDLGGKGTAEIDVFAGYKGEIARGVNFDVGILAYLYPSNALSPNANTTEVYTALSYGTLVLKYSHTLTNAFGNPGSKRSGYLDLSATFEVANGWMLTPHVGHQRITGPAGAAASYKDYALTLSKDFNGLVPSLAVVGSTADQAFYASPKNGKKLGKPGAVVGLKYTF
jgi:uncharacterized protein (TIGR02001 family)